jgi:hypothetical protein
VGVGGRSWAACAEKKISRRLEETDENYRGVGRKAFGRQDRHFLLHIVEILSL